MHPVQTTVSGNAGTATKLATARTLTIGSTGKTFDGSANVSWSLSEIGAAASSHNHTTINGVYTSNGGAQPPSYVGSGTVRFNMLNKFKGLSGLPTYADCILMDTYSGSDVPYVTGFGILKQSGDPRAFIAVGAKGNTTTWAKETELLTVANYKTHVTPANIGAAASSHGTHVTYSSTSPKVAGTAATGSEGAVARGDHVHPAQTSVSGNAGSATKLATARNIIIGNKTNSFNGTASITFTLSDIGAAAASHGTHVSYGGNGSATTVSRSDHTHSNYATTTTTGTLSSLKTSAKDSLVAAINEVFQSGSDAKTKLVAALTAKDVSASTSDSWDTLTSKVSSLGAIGSSLDIISASSLPSTVKNNQIVIITSTTPASINVKPSSICNPSANTVIDLGYSQSTHSLPYTLTNGKVTANLYFIDALQKNSSGINNRLESYIGVSGAWKQLTKKTFTMFDGINYNISGSWSGTSPSVYSNSISLRKLNTGASTYTFASAYYSTAIDVTNYTKMNVVISSDMYSSTVMLPGWIGLVKTPTTSISASTAEAWLNVKQQCPHSATSASYSINISSLSGSYYVGLIAKTTGSGASYATSAVQVYSIEFA